MKKITKYKCDHCKREYIREVNCIKHEHICWKNPLLKTCLTCIFFDGFDDTSDDYGFGRQEYIVCKEVPDLPTDKTPLNNCDYWVHDNRTKAQKKDDKLNDLVKKLNNTGLTL
jgi:hypothetical protein